MILLRSKQLDANATWQQAVRHFAASLADNLGKTFEETSFSLADTDEICQNKAADMVVFTCYNSGRDIQQVLNACRNLRIPYLILTPQMQVQAIKSSDNIDIPITMFEEELSKAQIATALGRFCGTHTTLIQANDYGTRAEKNVGKISTLIDKFNLPYTITKGKKDSYGVELESAVSRQSDNTSLLVITASRDYGMDDIIFGPKERKIIKRAAIPVLLLNPRGDLYSLCD